MAKTEPFDRYADEYDNWFQEHRDLYEAELAALRPLLRPLQERDWAAGLEIGVGSGMFAAPLGCPLGIEPSLVMAHRARRRGIAVAVGVAESLPVRDACLDYCLMVTTICFVDDPLLSFKEARRVLRQGGAIVVGFVDSESRLGRLYQERRHESRFYRDAVFYSCSQVKELLEMAGFRISRVVQTIFHDQGAGDLEDGCGRGSFVGICAEK